ncbi:hypothetical protein GJ744_012005 [Endocarpon pusillum]|uniref:Uncharacterized protein n=1 Tax=Endocarpon pusillum TaxID=364733 RepID=A0A8H7ATY4_9EURO|nr:hypothetical protein GJ744_012005 [Endocarpon pusillum]
MNVDILANNPAWWWYPVLACGVTAFTFSVWIIFKRNNTLEGNLESRFNWLFGKKRKEPDLEEAEVSEILEAEVSESWTRKAKTIISSAFKRKRS